MSTDNRSKPADSGQKSVQCDLDFIWGSKKGSKSGRMLEPNKQKLSKIEKQILDLLTEDFLTIKQIAITKNISLSRVYRVMKSLKKKGALTMSNQKVQNFEPTIPKGAGKDQKERKDLCKHSIRLHGQEFNIKILSKDERYTNIIGKVIMIDGNTVKCHRESIEVYSGHSFIADEVQKATARSMDYFTHFFVRLENDLKLILVKPRAQNITQVNQHYAEVNNELAQECESKGYKIRVYATDDSKLWFTIDNSFNLHEGETQHPQTAEEDMQDAVRPFFNDLRDNKPPKLSELMVAIHQFIEQSEEQARINKETAAGLNSVVQFMKSQQDQRTKPEEKEKDKIKADKYEMHNMYG